MIERTKNGLDPFACISAMQKHIRRGNEVEAFKFAAEMVNTSQKFCTMVCNRLELISHEDIDTATQPHIVPFVAASADQGRRFWKKDKPGQARLPLGNAIRMMCRAAKSREGDHFNGAIGIPVELGEHVPQVPDWAYDHHTTVGRKKGRGIAYFREESTRLEPPQAEPDDYEEAFYLQMHRRAALAAQNRPERTGTRRVSQREAPRRGRTLLD